MKGLLRKDRGLVALLVLLTFASLLIVLVVYDRVSSVEKQKNTDNTEADLYWFERTSSALLETNQRQVMRMMLNVHRFNDNSAFADEGALIMNSTPALTLLVWLGVDGVAKSTTRQGQNASDVAPLTRRFLEDEAIKKARYSNSNTVAGVFLMSDKTYEVSLIQPFYSETAQLMGFVKSHYSLDVMFQNIVPMWFTRKYHLHVYHNTDTVYTTMHDESVKFEAMHHTAERGMNIGDIKLLMKAQLYPDNQTWILRALFAGMVFLLLTLLFSLSALIRYMRRRRGLEKELSVQNNLRQAIETSFAVGIRAHAMDGSLIYANPAFLKMVGFEREEVLNIPQRLIPYVVAEEMHKVTALMKSLYINPTSETMVEIKMRKKTGEVIDTIVRGAPMYDEHKEHVGWISSVEDVTLQKQQEEAQKNEQKRLENVAYLVSMGEMASSIAHELNQPLSAISGYATGLSNYVAKDSVELPSARLSEVIEKIRRQAERAANVTRRVQIFAKQNAIDPSDIEVPALIAQVIEFVELELQARSCQIVFHDAEQNLPKIFVDNTMAQQILINIIRNAIDVMVEHKVLDRRIDIHAEQYSSHHVLISIADQGPGVPIDKVKTIFQPFYTTKTHGVGIGLNICRTMIESNGGRLWAKSSPHGGLFYITVPIWQVETQSKKRE